MPEEITADLIKNWIKNNSDSNSEAKNAKISDVSKEELFEELEIELQKLRNLDDLKSVPFKEVVGGKKSLKKIRKILQREVYDWTLSPILDRQNHYNSRFLDFLEQFLKNLDLIESKFGSIGSKHESIESKLSSIGSKHESMESKLSSIGSKHESMESKLSSIGSKHESIDSNINEVDNKLNKKIETAVSDVSQKIDKIHSNFEKNIKEIYEKNETTALQNFFEIESSIKKAYSEILQRSPEKDGLKFYVNKIKTGKADLSDLEKNLKDSDEYKRLLVSKKILKKLQSTIEKPIFIIGVPRTGTSFLHSILCAHKQLAWFSHENLKEWLSPNEQFKIESYYKWLKAKKKKIPLTEDALFVFGKKLGKGLRQFGVPPKGTSKIPIEGEIFWKKIFGVDFIKDVSINSKIQFLMGMNEAIKKEKKSRFVCKAPQNSMRLFAIHKILPDAKFINMIRDPRAVVSSMLQRNIDEGSWDPGIPIINQNKFNDLTEIEQCAWRYKEITDAIHEFSSLQGKNFLTVVYEKLIENTEEELKKILAFCELEKPKQLKRIIPTLRKGTSNKWTKKLSVEEERKIFDIVNSSLKKMKYPYQLSNKKSNKN